MVLINRDIVLTEQTVPDFAAEHGLNLLEEDGVAINRTILYSVEKFELREGIHTAEAFQDAAQMEGSRRRRTEQAVADRARDGDRRHAGH